jgi:hypothetical protein
MLEQVQLLAVQVYQVQRLASHHLVVVAEVVAAIIQMPLQLRVDREVAQLEPHRELL